MHRVKDNINNIFCDSYFSLDDGLGERRQVFVIPNDIVGRIAKSSIVRCAETGFGSGLSLAATLLEAWQLSGSIEWYSVEAHPLSPQTINALLSPFEEITLIKETFLETWKSMYEHLKPGWNDKTFTVLGSNIVVNLHLFFGDINDYLDELSKKLGLGNTIDAWFFDGHKPSLNPAMWTEQVFVKAAALSLLGHSSFASYSAAGIVKQGLRKAGFVVERKKGFGRKHHRLCGYFGGRD